MNKPILVDVTEVFANTRSRIISRNLTEETRVYAVKIPCYAGVFRKDRSEQKFFGEVVVEGEAMKMWGRDGRFFTSDEIPGYGVGKRETKALRERLGMENDDLALIVVNTKENAEKLVGFVVGKLNELIAD